MQGAIVARPPPEIRKEVTMHSRWTRSRVLPLALAAGLTVAIATPALAAPSRSFDTNGDGTIDLTIFDTNGDGFFAQSSSASVRIFLLRNHALLTTNPARTGLSGTAGNITLSHQKFGIDIRSDSLVDSGANVLLKTPYGVGNVCVASASTISAKGGIGTVDTRLVTGTPIQDATSTIVGVVLGKPFVEGEC
jgi:hypothetical protein